MGNLFGAVGKESIDSDLEAMAVWAESYSYAARQLEEVFCDCVGVWLFGQSYLHSFRYLLAPDLSERPSDNYPPNRWRSEFAIEAARSYGDSADSTFANAFRPFEKSREKKVEIADIVTKTLVPKIIAEANDFFDGKKLTRPSATETERCKQSLYSLCPFSDYESVGSLLNAAWELRLDLENWSIPGVPDDVSDEKKIDILNDLVFKSFEVVEWNGLRPRVAGNKI